MIRYIFLDRPGAHDHVARWRGRCTYCGHRVGADVVETRRRPWRIPGEMVGRFLAMRHGEAELDRMDALAADVDEETDWLFSGGPWVFVDDGFDEDYEDELERWDRRRD